MSARFVSTGAIDTKTGDAVALPTQPASSTTTPQKNDEWAAVQSQLEAERQAREAKRKAAASGEGGAKSLYEVLEANKAAKQAAFEEANKIRNQFRALDEDEIGFLEEVEMKKREEAERRKREMEEGLRVFREARKGERKEDDEGEEALAAVVEGGWKVGGKRKRRKGEGTEVSGLLLKGVKRRVSGGGGSGGGGNSSKEEDEKGIGAKEAEDEAEVVSATSKKKKSEAIPKPAATAPAAAAEAPKAKPKLGLVAYGSDSDDDDDDGSE